MSRQAKQARAARSAVVLGSTTGALAVSRGLGRAGVRATAVAFDRGVAYRSRFVDDFHLVSWNGANGLPAIGDVLERLGGRGSRLAVFPCTDGTVEWVAENWSRIRPFADVALPEDMSIVDRLVRKDLLPLEAARAGVPSPRTIWPSSPEDIHASELVPPLIVKGRRGKDFIDRFGKKLFDASTVDAAAAAWQRARAEGVEAIVQELVPDAEQRVFSLFAYVGRAGEPLAAVVGLKVREAPRPHGSSTVFVAQRNDRVEELGLRLLEASGYRGFAHVELAYDVRSADYTLIEVNARVPIWAGIAMHRDFNIAECAYLDLCGLSESLGRLQDGRTWVDLKRDVRAGIPRRPGGLIRFVRPYLRRGTSDARFALDDPAPAVGEIVRALRARTRGGEGIEAAAAHAK